MIKNNDKRKAFHLLQSYDASVHSTISYMLCHKFSKSTILNQISVELSKLREKWGNSFYGFDYKEDLSLLENNIKNSLYER